MSFLLYKFKIERGSSMYNFGKKKNQKLMAAIVIIVVAAMLITTVLAAFMYNILKFRRAVNHIRGYAP